MEGKTIRRRQRVRRKPAAGPGVKDKPVLSEREGEEGASPSLGLVVCGLSHSVSPSQARTNQGDETSLDG